MGVDYTFYSVVGFHFTPEQWTDALDRLGLDPDEDESLFSEWKYSEDGEAALGDLLTAGTLGNYYSNGDDNTHFIGVQRLTNGYDIYGAPGGVFEIKPSDEVTDKERKALRKLGKKILGYKPEVVSFNGLLIH